MAGKQLFSTYEVAGRKPGNKSPLLLCNFLLFGLLLVQHNWKLEDKDDQFIWSIEVSCQDAQKGEQEWRKNLESNGNIQSHTHWLGNL